MEYTKGMENNDKGFSWKKVAVGAGIIAFIIWLFRRMSGDKK